jgi:PTH2 family peptidyl-tRNA hydrolase
MKQMLIIRKDLGMRKGKMIAQGAHASLGAYLKYSDHPWVKEWLKGPFKKIAVSVNSEEELLSLYRQAEILQIPRDLIKDAGLTEFGGVATYTAIALGPAPDDVLDPLTGELKLL